MQQPSHDTMQVCETKLCTPTPDPSATVDTDEHGPVNPCRAIPGGDHPQEHSGVHEDVLQATGQATDLVWRSEVGTKISGCGSAGPKVHDVVRQEVRDVPETC